MGRTTDFPDISSDYPDLSLVPTANELMVTVNGRDFNISIQRIFETAVAMGLSTSVAAALAAQVDDYISGGGGGGPSFPLLDEDDFHSNSASAAPSQQSTKAYVDNAVSGATVGNDSVTNLKLANMATATLKGRSTAGTGDPEDLTAAQARALLNVEDGAQANLSAAGTRDLLTTLTLDDRLDQSAMKGFTGSNHGGLVLTGIAANLSPSALQFIRRDAGGTGWEVVSLGTAAYIAAAPTGAPTSASSSSGSITLDFTDTDYLTTAASEAIATVSVTLTAYQFGYWLLKQTTARNVTFPAGTVVFGNGGLLLLSGVANSSRFITFYMDNTTLYAIVGDAGVVGA